MRRVCLDRLKFGLLVQAADEQTQANVDQNVADAISIMPKLKTGLDVNVKFTGCGIGLDGNYASAGMSQFSSTRLATPIPGQSDEQQSLVCFEN